MTAGQGGLGGIVSSEGRERRGGKARQSRGAIGEEGNDSQTLESNEMRLFHWLLLSARMRGRARMCDAFYR